MKHYRYHIFSIVFILTFGIQSYAQHTGIPLLIKSGKIIPMANMASLSEQGFPTEWATWHNNYYCIVQFSSIPDEAAKKALHKAGINLLNYLPEKAWFAKISPSVDIQQLSSMNMISILMPSVDQKLHPLLDQIPFPVWAVPEQGMLNIIVTLYPGIELSEAISVFERKHIKIIRKNTFGNSLTLSINNQELKGIAGLAFVQFVEPVDPPSEAENYTGRTLHRANILSPGFPGGRTYDGSGVKVMLQDDGTIGPHIDYDSRIGAQYISFNNGTHGDHIAGTILGAGNLDPKTKGMAPGAEIYVYEAAPIYSGFDSIPIHYFNPGIVISSTSYSNGCNAGYTSFSHDLDRQIRLYPALMHVFSSGNAGTSNCGYGAGAGWGNITGGHKMGKNVIATGNLSDTDFLLASSSRGPASDGRIKPDICAKGSDVYSTQPPNTYDYKTGTSMACPGISGSLAALYSAYKALNAGNNPDGGLMKALIMNTADDLGNPGPDFKYGWGRINNLRAVKVLEQYHYLKDSIVQASLNQHNLTIPAGIKQARIMLYWTDYEAVANASIALVNDLGLQVVTPAGDTINPWILDPTPNASNLNKTAVRGIDHLNNVEQVTIDTPASGNYQVLVNGYLIPQGPQSYYLVYEWVNDSITVTYPVGGESLVPGETEKIRWDAYGNNGNFNINYSTDGGLNWYSAGSTLNGSYRYFNWTVPDSITGQALIKVSRGIQSDISDANFSIMYVPFNIHITSVCPDSTFLQWDSLAAASGYIVYQLGSNYMDSVAYTTQNHIILHGINSAATAWFSVAASGQKNAIGRRAIAIEKTPGVFNCPTPNDLAVRINTPEDIYLPDCLLQDSIRIDYNIENSASNNLSGPFTIQWTLDASPIANINIAGPLTVGTSSNHFIYINISGLNTGIHKIKMITNYSGDTDPVNNSDSLIIELYPGISKTPPYSENFESFQTCNTTSNCEQGTCALINGWKNLPNGAWDNIDFRTDNGGTPSLNTGPSIDHNPGNGLGKYLYTESSVCFEREAALMMPCIDLTNASIPKMSFWYYMYGLSMGSLHVDILSDMQWQNDVFVRSGNQGNSWKNDTLDLSAYAGKSIGIRFRGITGPSYTSDITIDDISLLDMAAPLAAFSATPSPGCKDSSIVFTSNSSGSINTWAWDFGADANPATANTPGPHTVVYSSSGYKTISLSLSGSLGNSTKIDSILVNESPVADFSFSANQLSVSFTDLSTYANAWYWDFGDGNHTVFENPIYTYASGGIYPVTLSASNLCGADSITYSVAVWPLGVQSPSIYAASLYPNPSRGMVHLSGNALNTANIQCKLYSLTGQQVWSKNINVSSDYFSVDLNLKKLSAGVYFLELLNQGERLRMKLTLQ